MMCRIAIFFVFVVALGTIGCGGGERQQDGATTTKVATDKPEVEQQKPNPAPPPVAPTPPEPSVPAVSAAPAKSDSKPPSISKVRRVVAVPTGQCAPAVSRACELANGIINVPPAERVAWAKQEFAKRGIPDVHDDQ